MILLGYITPVKKPNKSRSPTGQNHGQNYGYRGTGARVQLSDLGVEEKLVEAGANTSAGYEIAELVVVFLLADGGMSHSWVC